MTLSPVTVQYGPRTVFKDFTITFSETKVTAILGPSGCGKTSLLFSISSVFGKTARISFVFQEPRLIPWLSLEKNLSLVLDGSEEDKRERSLEYLDKVHLRSSANKLPREISGGERQRVSIARAFSCPSSILLMDEPFQSQDPGLKKSLIDSFRDLQKTEQRTVIAVTHDIPEALQIADHILVIGGKPAQAVCQGPVTDFTGEKLSLILTEQSKLFAAQG